MAAPDQITWGSPGNGAAIHLAGEIFNTAAGIKLRHIPYKGSNPAMMDVLAGNVDLRVSSLPSAVGSRPSASSRPASCWPRPTCRRRFMCRAVKPRS